MKLFLSRIKFSRIILGIFLLSTQQLTVHAQGEKVTFAVIGDYGLAGQNEADVANLVKSWNPDFIVTTGDNNYPDGAAWSIDQNIGQYYHDYIFPYNGKYGNGSPTKRFFPSLGNHDWGVNSGVPFFNYFGFRYQEGFYDFVQGPVHFFILNSNKEEPEGFTSTSSQAKWLKKALAASTSAFNIVVFHHPPYSSGRHGSNEYMRWPFKEWGADAVLNGHDHTYERLIVDGLPYFVNGIGGAELYNFEKILPESKVRFNQDFGAMRVEATSTTMKFQMFTRTGALIDEYVIGQANPSVTAITIVNQSPTNASTLNYQVTFSESVIGVDITDFTLATNISDATISSVSGSANVYNVTVNSGNGDGTLRLDLTDNDSITNSMGNYLGGPGIGNGSFANGQTYNVDKTTPAIFSITRSNPSPTNATTVDFLITFSEPVTGVDFSDFGLTTNTGASINNISGSGSSYLITATTDLDDNSLRLDFIDNDSVVDMAGNTTDTGFTNGEAYAIDRNMPFVTSITRTNPSQVNAYSVDFTVSFSESVNGVDRSDFFVSTSNGASIINILGSGNIYTISVSTKSGNDTIRVDLIDDDSIFDNAGNKLGSTSSGNGNFTSGETYTISQNVPTVTSILRANSSPTNTASVDFIVTFSEPVIGVDASDFLLSGNTDATILNINNSNPFYVVTVSTGTSDSILKLDLIDDDSIRNGLGVNLGGEGAGNANYTNGEVFSIDRTSPQITSIIRANSNPTINPSVDFIITFSEPITGMDATDLLVTTANLNSSVSNIQNANPFFIVSVNTGAGSGTLRLDLINNGSITDLTGNKLTNGNFTTGEAFTIAKIPVNFPAPNISNSNRISLINNPRPNLSWGTVRHAKAYEFFIAQDANFTQVILNQTISTTDFTPPFPLGDGTYYMKLRAYNTDLSPGKFSKVYAFTIDTTPPPPPMPVSPPNQSTSSSRTTLQWQAVAGDTQYQIEIDNNADFSRPEFTDITSKVSLRSKSLSRGSTYYWHVRAKDKAGNWSEWSASFMFFVP